MRELHVPGEPLVLPNAWDVASARAIVAAGFPVVATTSGGVAAALGYEDHEGAPAEAMFAVSERIVACVDVPVTVDAEAGYGMVADDLVERLKAMGVAGANLEDTDHSAHALQSIEMQRERITAVRAVADRLEYPLVINARVDTFIAEPGRSQMELLDAATARASGYLAAGADCVYPIFLHDAQARRRFVEAVDGPVNILTWPGGASVSELGEEGAARVSYGTTLHRTVMGELDRLLKEISQAADRG